MPSLSRAARGTVLAGLMVAGLGLAGLAVPADAATTRTNAPLDLYASPDAYAASVGAVPMDAHVEVIQCTAGFAWCEIAWAGYRGWTTGKALNGIAGGPRFYLQAAPQVVPGHNLTLPPAESYAQPYPAGIYAVELPHGAVNPHHVFTPGSFGPFGPHDLYGHEAAID